MLPTASHMLSDSLTEKKNKNVLAGKHDLRKYNSVHLIYFLLCTFVIWCLLHEDAAAAAEI